MSRTGITKVCHQLAERKKPVLGVALSSASLLALAVMLTSHAARAANECGAEGLGADTIVCTGASYPTNGITYQNSDGLTLVLNNPNLVTDRAVTALGGVYVSSTAGNTNDIVVNAFNFQSVSAVPNTSSGIGAVNFGTAGNAVIRMDSGTVTSRSNAGSLFASVAAAGGTGNALVTLNGGQVSNTLTGLPAYGATAINLGLGNATLVMTGGSVSSTAGPGAALRALINNAASFGNASVTLSAGTVTANPGIGILSQSERGSASINLTGGTVLVQSGTGNALSAVVNNAASAGDASISAAGGSSVTGMLSASNIGNGKSTIAINAGTFTAGAAQTVFATHSSGTGESVITMNGGTASNSTAAGFTLYALNSGSATGNATVLMTAGSVQTGSSSSAVALNAEISNAASNGTASVTMTGGTMTGTGVGARASTNGSGLAQITVNGGSYSGVGSGARADASAGTGNAQVNITGGSLASTGLTFAQPGMQALSGSGSALASMSGGSISINASAGYALIATSQTGSTTATMTDGTLSAIGSAGGGVRANIVNAGSSADAMVTFSGGSITSTGANSIGLSAQTLGSGVATIQLSGGASGTGGTIGSVTGAQSLAVSGLSSIRMEAGAITTTAQGLSASSTTGDAMVTITGGTISTTGNAGHGANAFTATGAGTTTAVMSGGSITTAGQLAVGLRSQNFNGLAVVRMTGGTITASGNGADGILATNQNGTGTYDISITGGTVTGGANVAAAVHGYSTAGGVISIGAGAILNAGGSGNVLINTGSNAGAAAITTAGTLTGNINLAAAANTLDITGGSIAGDINGGGSTALSFTLGAGNSFTYGAPYTISGVAGTTVNSGTVIMDGTLSGSVTIAGGTLQLGNGANSGSIATDVVNNGSFAFDRADSITFANAISGTGNVVQAGSGTTILTGANSYSGGTVLNAGVLQAAADANLGDAAGALTFNGGTFENSATFASARSVTLTGNGTFQTDADLTLSGAISGNGALAKTGSGTLILTGASTYSGGTTISAGILQIGNGGATGSITGNITNNTSLLINRSGSLNLAGTISGTGSISQVGSGSTTLSGVNSYAGGTVIAAGTLIGSDTSFGSGAVLDNAALVIGQPADGAMANAINGTGSFTKQGVGRLNFTGTGTLTGSTTVAAGLLSVNGALGSSPVTVQSGAGLGGNGTVGTSTIQSGGTIAPGNSIGTLHVNGAFVQSAGSIYQVEVDPNTNASDLIAVSGTATLQSGAGLNVSKYVPGEYQLGTVYKVLTAGGGLSGTYTVSGQTTGVSPFLGLKDSYDANNAYLTVVQTQPLTNVATTPNQQAVANAVQALPPIVNPATSASAPNPVQIAVLNLPDAPAARAAFDQLSGQTAASAQGALLANGLYVRDIAFDRLRDVMCAPASARRACNGKQLSIWGQGFGGWGGIAGNGNAAGLNHSSAGFLAGADVPVDDWRLGFFGGYSRSEFNIVSGGAAGGSNDYHLGAYGGTLLDNVALRLGASYTWSGITTSRAVAIGGFSDNLRGLYNGGTSQAFGELAYGMDADDISLEPFANLTYVGLRTSAFTEAGGTAALTVRGNTTENMISTFGLRPAMDVDLGGIAGTLRGMASWRHTFGTVTPDAQVSFAGGNVFGVTGAPIARDAGALEAGIDVNLDEAITIGLTYGGQFSDRTTDQSARGNFRISF